METGKSLRERLASVPAPIKNDPCTDASRLARLHAMFSLTYGSVVLNLNDPHKHQCLEQDLERLCHDATQIFIWASAAKVRYQR